MQNQNLPSWAWSQSGAQSFQTGSVYSSTFSPGTMDQNQLMSGYQQMYGGTPSQPHPQPPDYGASQWSAAQLQHWQQWQQWQEKYQQWQAQYGKKYAETIAAMGQNPNMMLPNVPPVSGVVKADEEVHNAGYTSANPPPPPSNAQPVPPPPPEEEKTGLGDRRDKIDANESDGSKESPEELSEAEKTFDIQFKQWEDQFNEWKKQNQDHPDKAQYREYEKKWETWREQLLQRREQMRKKRLNKTSETNKDTGSGKNDGGKEKTEHGSGGNAEDQNQSEAEAKQVPYGSLERQGMFPQHKPEEGNPVLSAPFVGVQGMYPNIPENRIPGYFDKDNQNFGGQLFAPGNPDRNSQMFGMENNANKDFSPGPRMDNPNRGDFLQRRPFGNVNFEDERNFGSRFNFDARKPNFPDLRLKDGKFNSSGRDAGLMAQLSEQAFAQTPRNFQDRNFPVDMKPPFIQNASKNNLNSSFSKPRVPSLFDITVEKPVGLRSPVKDKPKIWEQDSFEGGEKDEKNPQRSDNPWLTNMAWGSNNSPWIKPWELDRVVAEKPPDTNLRSDAWQKEPLIGSRSDDKPWPGEIRKADMDKSELSGYVGKILAKLGSFSAIPSNVSENPAKVDENVDNKLNPFMQNPSWRPKNNSSIPNPNIFNQDAPNYQGNFARDRLPNDADKRGEEPPLFGDGDCDDRIRFDRTNFGNRRDDRNFVDPFRRDERPFPEMAGNRIEDSRFRNSFGRDDRPVGKFPAIDDVDERKLRNRDRGGRRVIEDRDDRLFRGLYDRDERRNHGPFERFNRNVDSGAKNQEWNPQVFDYSKGNQQNFRSRFSESNENFQIPTVVDYNHGENKQTFDYGHGEGKNDKIPVKSIDYGHGAEPASVIDYAHGNEKEITGLQQWKKECLDKSNEDEGSRSGSRSPQRRSRSPRGRPGSRSRSPYSGARTRRDSNSPPFRAHRSRSRDRFNRQNIKRNRRNNSEEKSIQNPDGDSSKSSFDVTTVLIEDLICSPGRETRPNKLVFIMRGLPGSGKTYVTKLIKDKEVELGGDAPRILSLDDYFMTEVEKEVVDEETGRKIKKKVLEYEYESCAEPHYRGSLLKALKKTISDGFFSFIIVDSVNEKTKDYEEMWSFAKQKGFQVYVAEMDDDVTVCTKRNIHKRTEKEISDLAKAWEKTPNHYLRLDVRSLLQADAITEVEMEVVSDTELEKESETEKDKEKENDGKDENGSDGDRKRQNEEEDEDEDEPGESAFVKSRWDHFENSEQKLDRLDGLKRRREGFHAATMQDYLQLPDDFDVGSSEPTDGKKKVRWADLEERRQQEKMRAIGFVVGQTDWSRMTDPTFGASALTRTKFI